ncbi:MAG TPA: T9SS type A sorting domain-containing protein [Bacteroidia bacterium]|nr:T9SS type A sorting domain-containing protein [Bacteroidia bacterium]
MRIVTHRLPVRRRREVSVFKIDIINSGGQNAASKSFAESHEENNFEIPLTGFSKGIYLLRMYGNGKALSEKFIVE